MANSSDENSASPQPNRLVSPAASIFPASASTNQPVQPSISPAETYSLTEAKSKSLGEFDGDAAKVQGTSRSNSDHVATGKRLSKNSAWVLIGCNLLVFVSSVCVMVLELTASRLIAKHVGNSLYTWTSVIGVVLAGITIGNFLGGWLADRAAPSKLLNWLFLTASILCMSVLWLDGIASNQQRPDSLSWPVWVVCIVGMVFFLPSTALGTISPVVASLALSHSRKIGSTVGNVYAWGALGSIIGTFLGGFVLIDTLGTRAIVALVAATLAAMGFLSAGSQWAFRSAVLFGWMQFVLWVGLAASVTEPGMKTLALAFGEATTITSEPFDRSLKLKNWESFGKRFGNQLHELGLTLGLREDNLGEYHDESNYSYINVTQQTENGERVAVLKLDKLIHSYFVLDNPTALNYDYEKVYAAVTEQAVATWDRSTTVSLADVRREVEEFRQASAIRFAVPPKLEEGRGEGLDALDEAAKKVLDEGSNDPKSETDGGTDSKADAKENVEATEALTRPSATLSQGGRGRDGDSRTLAEVTRKLPSWITLDAEKQTLSVLGGMTPEMRTELLRRHPCADYWQAVERLDEITRRADWGDFGSVPLASLPKGVELPVGLKEKLIYDRHLQSLNVYRSFNAEDVRTLLHLGDIEAVTYRESVERLYRQSRHIGTLFLGGGGFVFPRWIESMFPHEPLIHVAELDPGVKAAVQAKMGLPPDDETHVKTTIGDARNFVEDRVRWNAESVKRGEKPVLYDFIYGDAFNDFSVPWHLTTKEFSEKIASLLHPTEGIYQVNLIDIYPRTEFPSHRTKEGRDVSDPNERIAGDVPEILTRQATEPGEWAGVPAPFEGLEIAPTQDYAGYRLAVRGVMSDPLRDRLLKLSAGKAGFDEAVQKLYARSYQQRTGRFLGSYVHTISYVFPYVYVFSSEITLPHAGRDTFVIVASKRKLDLTDLRQASKHWSGSPFASLEMSPKGERLARGQMGEILANAHKMVLTDDFAPVDNLLSAVFDER